MPIATNNNIRHDFDRNGFVGPLDILTQQQAQETLIDVQKELKSSNASRFKLHLVLRSIADIVHHPILVEAVQTALNSKDILLWSSDINIKQPNSEGYFAPHQDSTYAGLVPPEECLTAWIALSDPVGPQEGCLSFYRGSHKLGQIRHEVRDPSTDNNMLSLGQYISLHQLESLCITEDKMETISLRSGQATFHSFTTVHVSGPNRSDHPRVGLALRYITARVCQSKPTKELVTLVSSTVPIHHFDLETEIPLNPTQEDIEKGREQQKDAIRREETNYFSKRKVSSNQRDVSIGPNVK